jgi:hypothetical protein
MNIKVFGAPSGIALFLIPCALVALLGFRRPEWRTTVALLLATLAAWGLNGHEGQPIGRFHHESYDHFFQLNVYSVAALSTLILWRFISARRVIAPL